MIGGFAVKIIKENIAIHIPRSISLSDDLADLRWLYLEGKKICKSIMDETKDTVYLVEEEKGNFSFWILNKLLGMIAYCEFHNISYCMNIRASKEKFDLWKTFFEETGMKVEEINVLTDLKEIKKLDLGDQSIINLDALDIFDPVHREIMFKMYKKYVKLNKNMQEYFEAEYNELIKGRKVLGVLYRGTDYTKLKPSGHPIQPSLEQILQECKRRIKVKGYKYIYITTDEKRAVEFLQRELPECNILENRRNYFDDFYNNEEMKKDIAACRHNRENDKLLTAKEYISSVFLLSKCDELIAGNCGGSRAAIYLNNGKYKRVKLYKLGLYE